MWRGAETCGLSFVPGACEDSSVRSGQGRFADLKGPEDPRASAAASTSLRSAGGERRAVAREGEHWPNAGASVPPASPRRDRGLELALRLGQLPAGYAPSEGWLLKAHLHPPGGFVPEPRDLSLVRACPVVATDDVLDAVACEGLLLHTVSPAGAPG